MKLTFLTVLVAAALTLGLGGKLVSAQAGEGVPSVNDPTFPDGVTKAELVQGDYIDAFVQPIIAKYGNLAQVSIDQADGRILIATGQNTLAELADAYDGEYVGGLRVDVAPATYSPAAYENAIRAIGKAKFANHSLITSYNLPASGDAIEVAITGLDKLAPEIAAGIERDAAASSGTRVRLVKSMLLNDFAGR